MDKIIETTLATLAYDRDRWKQRAESLGAEIERLKAGQDDPNPLTLEELRERGGKPIYTKTIGVIGSGRWEFIAIGDTWVYLKTAIESYKMTALEFVNSYGKSWLAYDRPPKED